MGKRSKLKAKLNSERPNFLDQLSGQKPQRPVAKKLRIKSNEPEKAEYIEETLSTKILKEAVLQTQELTKNEQPPLSMPQNNLQSELNFCHDFVSNVRKELVTLENDDQCSIQSFGLSEEALFDDIIVFGEDQEVVESLNGKLWEIESQLTSNIECEQSGMLDPEAYAMYDRVKHFLSIYRSGPIPKAFKVVPCFSNWLDILKITDPAGWSAAAMYEATRIFVSRLQADQAQHFLALVLLPRIRDDIKYYKKLNFHIFRALKKALFKPTAFFKGILIPLCCESPDFTLREATIISAVLSRVSIPVEHSAAVLIMLSTTENGVNHGAKNIVIRVLLEKRYAIPYQAIDSLVAYFMRFERSEREETPVLWHCALLAFAKNYAVDLAIEQIEMLWKLLKSCRHPKITPLVRSALTEAQRNCILVETCAKYEETILTHD